MTLAYLLRRITDRLHLALAELHWWVLAAAALGHAGIAWLWLRACGEDKLGESVSFLYWYATTAFTVGYGDLSPQTAGGRLVTAAFVFPGAIAIFTTIVAKSLSELAGFWRRRRSGHGDFSKMTDTILLIGFDPERTPKMIAELHADARGARIVLMTRKAIDEPDPRVLYVRARSLTDPEELARAGAPAARRVAIYAATDGDTLAAALAVTAINAEAHVVCFFDDGHNAELLRLHCPNVECIAAPGPEMVIRAVQDPGSSRVLSALVSHLDRSVTLYSLEWREAQPISFRTAAERFLARNATLLAWQAHRDAEPSFDIRSDAEITPGARLFYVAEHRLDRAGAV